MTRRTDIQIVQNGFGGQLPLYIHRFGIPGGRPRIYLQAGTHTEELPGPLVIHHLKQVLEAIPADEWRGEAVLVPFANPIGLSQALSGHPMGRIELASGTNFNLGWPRPQGTPGGDQEEWLARTTALTGLGGIRLALMRAACGADVVIDLHCSMEPAIAFAFVDEGQADAAARLAAALRLDMILTLPSGGSGTFMDAAADLGPSRLVATVELRGHRDISDRMARRDAEGLVAYLRDTGILKSASSGIEPWDGAIAAYDRTVALPARIGGIFLPRAEIRDVVEENDLLGEIVSAVPTEGRERLEIRAPCKAMILSHADPARLLHPGAPSHVLLPLEPLRQPPDRFFDIAEDWG